MSNIIELKNVDVFYGRIQVLWDISFGVNEGEIVAIVGPNGAGKSTLLQTIFGMHKAQRGEIWFGKERIDKRLPYEIQEKGICYVPDRGRIFTNLTVLENLKVAALTRKAQSMEKYNLKMIFNIFPRLKERIDQKAGTLSGGERQMLIIARGLMASPKVMLLDEPFFGLAPKIIQKVTDILREINQSGVTIVLSEQYVKRTLELSERGFVIENGKIVLKGLSSDLISNDYVKKVYLGT